MPTRTHSRIDQEGVVSEERSDPGSAERREVFAGLPGGPGLDEERFEVSDELLDALLSGARTAEEIAGPDGLLDNWASGPAPRLSAAQKAELAKIVERGPDREVDGVVRWRRIDLKRVIAKQFGVGYCERYVGTLLKKLGFSHISARPRHPAQDAETVAAYKKTLRAR